MGPKEISWVPAFLVSHLIILWAQKKYIGFQANHIGFQGVHKLIWVGFVPNP